MPEGESVCHYRAVFLSPHLDDAVFSCAGQILALKSEGPICVLNIFTSYSGDRSGEAVPLDSKRYDEELNASALLGYVSTRLDESDAFFRAARYRKIGNIFKPLPADQCDQAARITAQVMSYLDQLSFDDLYVPLGVGWHVDHMMTHDIGRQWAQKHPGKVYFYEDSPYCLIDGVLDARLIQLGQSPKSFFSVLSQYIKIVRSFWSTGMMQNSVPFKILAAFSYPFVCIYLWRTLWAHMNRSDGSKTCFVPEIKDVRPYQDQKMNAVRQYESQVKVLFNGDEDLISRYTTYATKIGGPGAFIERFWRIASPR